MLTNNRSPEKDNDFRKRIKHANEIYEFCRLLSEQQKAVDDSCSENISEISLSSHPNVHQFSKQKFQKKGSPENNERLINISNLNYIPFDEQNHADSLVSLNSELLFGNCPTDVFTRDSPPSNTNQNKEPRAGRHLEFVRQIHEPSKGHIDVVNIKTTPHVDAEDKLFKNRRSHEVSLCNNMNMIGSAMLKKDEFSSFSSLRSEDTFVTSVSNHEVQTTMPSCSQSLSGLKNLFHGAPFCTGKQNSVSFSLMDASKIGFQKDNSWYKTVLHNADGFKKQKNELKTRPEQVFNSRSAESKLISFNFSLHLENKRCLKDGDGNLKVSRKLSAPSIADLGSKGDENVLFAPTRKCKSEVRILHEPQSGDEIKLLTDSNKKNANFDSNPAIIDNNKTSAASLKVRRIPTLGGRKLPAKVSVLLLKGPILLTYTENILGKSREILMFASDAVGDIIRDEDGILSQDIVNALLAKSRPYVGKPIHIIFEPRKTTKPPSPAHLEEGNPVHIHPCPAKHNLLAEEPKIPRNVDCLLSNETNPDNAKFCTLKNRKDESLAQNDQLKGIGNRMRNTDWPVSSTRPDNNRVEPGVRKKLKIRLCHRKKSRTALKRVNVEQIVSSVFRNFFHFYSILGGHGSVITKSSSIRWLKEAGIATDTRSLEMASELFKGIAGAKVVLNIFDYIQFLGVFARRQRLVTVDLIRELTVCKLPMVQNKRNNERRRLRALPLSRHLEEGNPENGSMRRSRSWPNLKRAPSIANT